MRARHGRRRDHVTIAADLRTDHAFDFATVDVDMRSNLSIGSSGRGTLARGIRRESERVRFKTSIAMMDGSNVFGLLDLLSGR